MSKAEFSVQDKEHIRGAWLTSPESMLCIVSENGLDYVAAYSGNPQVTKQLPYALKFEGGELVLQIPDESGNAKQFKMAAVESLIAAARGL